MPYLRRPLIDTASEKTFLTVKPGEKERLNLDIEFSS